MNTEHFLKKKFDLNFELDHKKFIDDLHERLLDEFCIELNSLHNIKWSKRVWRIFIGPWLTRYISSILRLIIEYQELEKNNQINFIDKTKEPSQLVLTCNDLIEFSNNIQSKEFVYKFFIRINSYFKNNEKKFNYLDYIKKKESRANKRDKLSYKFKINFFKFFQKILFKQNDIIIYKIYFGNFISTLKLFIKLRQFPFKYNLIEKIPKFEIDISIRSKINLKKSENLYEKILRDFILEIMPTNYIEGFKLRLEDAENSFLPKKAKYIYSCSIYSDYRFKYWACGQINNGAKLIYGQHGAAYNAFIYDQRSEHEIKISDLYFSWGWTAKSKRIIPCGVFSITGKKLHKNNAQKNKILYLPGIILQRPYENIISRFVDRHTDKKYQTYQLEKLDSFLKKMKKEDLKNFFVKPHPNEKSYDFKISDFLKMHNEIEFLEAKKEPLKIVNDYDLVLFSNFDSTAFYHLLSLNKPVAVIINDYNLILKEEYKKIWQEMIDAKIFHLTADSLSLFVENNRNNFNKWWHEHKTQNAVNNFNNLNCRNEKNLPSLIADELKKFKNNI